MKKIQILKGLAIALMLVISMTQVFAKSDLTPKEALQKLKEGNVRFASGTSQFMNLDQARRDLTSQGQHPFATIIGCSDSRVPIEYIFDVGIGEVFVIRVAGNVVAEDEAGSIEYGVQHLPTPVFVVLGHTSCGAVTAVARQDELHGNLPALVDNILPAVERAKHIHGDEFTPELLATAVKENVWQSIEDLLKSSPGSSNLVESKKLLIVGAIYNLETGEVEWLGEHPAQAELLKIHSESNTEHNH